MFKLGRRLIPALAVLSAAGAAGAQEYCVACTEPSAVYRCVIDGAQPRGDQPLQMLCVTAMAKAGGHATCGIKRGTVFDCNGPVRHVPWSADAAAPPIAAQPQASAPQPPRPPPAGAAAPQPPADAPPKTVVELAKRANEETAAQMKKAGETMKEATRKTWNCMISFFTRC